MTSLKITRRSSGTAIWWRVRADLRGRRAQSISVTLVVALSALLVSLGLVTIASISAPYDRLFTQLNGAHLWVRLSANPTPAQLEAITTAPNVTGATELEDYIIGSAVVDSNKASLYFESYPIQEPAIDRILITQGNGLAANDPNGVVIDQSLVDAYHLRVGDTLSIVTAQGTEGLHVRGISVDVRHGSDDGGYRCRASGGYRCRVYAQRAPLERLFPAQGQLQGILGLRLTNPHAIQPTITTLTQRVQAQGATLSVWGGDDWLSFRAAFGAFSSLAASLLLGFGLLGLFAAGVIVANLVIGQVVAQQRELGMLKALGFTPLQLVGLLVCEYLFLGLLGSILGLALATLAAPMLMQRIAASLGVPAPPQYNLSEGLLLLAGILLVIAVCTALPAWRAGRLRTVDAIRPGGAMPRRGRSWLARLELTGRLPLLVTLGLRGITARPLRSLLVSLTLLAGVITAVFGLGLSALIQRYTSDPGLQGIYADVQATPDLYDPSATQQLIASRPEVASYYTAYQVTSKRGEKVPALNIYFAAGDTRRVAETVSEGRWYHEGTNELVVSAPTLQHMGAQVGDKVPLVFATQTSQTVQAMYTIVGILPEIASSNLVYAPLSSFTALHAQTPATILAQSTYEITLRSGVSVQAFTQTLLKLTDERLQVRTYTISVPSSISQLNQIMTILSIALMLIAGISVLNALLLSTQERTREFGMLKAIGLTPRQMIGSVSSGAITLAALAVIIGIPLGLWVTSVIITMLVKSRGLAGVALEVNWLGLALLVPATLLIAALGAYLPARRAARVSAGDVLRDE
jgi:putative ABC transport system permease protein